MKRLSTIVLMSLVGVALLHAQVTFRFSGGISNEQLKQNVERNVSALLSESIMLSRLDAVLTFRALELLRLHVAD